MIERWQHNHAPDSVDVEVRKLRKCGYEEALSSTESTQSVAATALVKVPMRVKAEMLRTSCLLRSVRRARQENSSKLYNLINLLLKLLVIAF